VQGVTAALQDTAELLIHRCTVQQQAPPNVYAALHRAGLILGFNGLFAADSSSGAARIKAALSVLSEGLHENFVDAGLTDAALTPLLIAGGDAAALPAELQPYDTHMRALMGPW
jgi:hypothetical protein